MYEVEDPFKQLLINNLVASKHEDTIHNPSNVTKAIPNQVYKGKMPKFDLLTPRILS